MPSRSSRSRPASRTSLSDPTGSASLATAIAGNLTTGVLGPGERVADLPEPSPRFLVAERSRDAGVVERARGQAEGRGRLVVAREVGVEHRGVVGRDRAADAGGDEARQWVVVQRRHGARPEVRQWADVEDRGAGGQLADEPGVLLGADPVAEPVGPERLERAADRRGAGDLARVRHRTEPERLRPLEDLLVRLRRELRLEPAEADADDAAVAVARGPLDRGHRLLLGEAARDVGGEADLDAVELARLLRAVADALEDVLPRAAVTYPFGRAEDSLQIDRAVRGGLRRVVDDHLAVVLFLLQGIRGEDPDVDE